MEPVFQNNRLRFNFRIKCYLISHNVHGHNLAYVLHLSTFYLSEDQFMPTSKWIQLIDPYNPYFKYHGRNEPYY